MKLKANHFKSIFMCFQKGKRKVKIAQKDMFVTKSGAIGTLNSVCFLSPIRDFMYSAGKVYKKGLWYRLRARFQNNLESEVYHCYDTYQSKDVAVPYHGGAYNKRIGVFMIPKGTKYYDGSDRCIATFAIKYLGPLDEERAKLILQQ